MIAEKTTLATLREWTFNDLQNLVKYANNPHISCNLTNHFPSPYTKQDGIHFIERALRHQPTQLFAIDINGEAIGSIGIFPQEDIYSQNAEIGYWIAEPFWGKGHGPAAMKLIVKYGFETWNITRIFARPFGFNKASQKALEKAGFTREAYFEKIIFKNGEMMDELVYAIRK